MTERTINAGDWLEHEHYGRVRVAGFDEEGDPVFAVDRGSKYQCDLMPFFLSSTRSLPGCDSWDWVEPVKQFVPRYFVPVAPYQWSSTNRYVYVSDQDGNIECVYSDGRRERQDIRVEKIAADARTWREIWESDAKAILMPQEMPIGWKCPDCGEFRGHGHEDVCHMAWVEITDPEHVLRDSDEMDACGNPVGEKGNVSWIKVTAVYAGGTVAAWKNRDEAWRFRCRRKDLPVQSVADACEATPDPASPFGDAMRQPANRVPVRLVGRRSGEVRWMEFDESLSVHDVIIQHDQNGFYLERET